MYGVSSIMQTWIGMKGLWVGTRRRLRTRLAWRENQQIQLVTELKQDGGALEAAHQSAELGRCGWCLCSWKEHGPKNFAENLNQLRSSLDDRCRTTPPSPSTTPLSLSIVAVLPQIITRSSSLKSSRNINTMDSYVRLILCCAHELLTEPQSFRIRTA